MTTVTIPKRSNLSLLESFFRRLAGSVRRNDVVREVRPKVLLVRCSRLPHFKTTLAQVRERYPGHEIEVLAKQSLVSECRSLPDVQGVLAYPDRPYSLLTMLGLLPRLRKSFYSLVVLPVTSAASVDYLNVELAMLPIRFARIVTSKPTSAWLERERLRFVSRDLPMHVFLFYADLLDAPLLFLLLLVAHAMRPFRWFRERVSRLFGPPVIHRKIMHCIPTLGMGGAQRQMLKVIGAMQPRYDVSLCLLSDYDFFFGTDSGPSGVKTHVLNQGSQSWALSVFRLYRLLRRERIEVLQTWLPMANVTGAIAGTLAGTPRIIASERSQPTASQPWYPQRWFRWASALAARLNTVVTANSSAVLEEYVHWARLRHKRVAVIYNGIDAGEFDHLDEKRKEQLRAQLGLTEVEAVVGIFGRLEAEKDHLTFLKAIQIVRGRLVNVRALIVGGGSQDLHLRAVVAEMGLSDRVLFLGNRSDATTLMQVCDAIALTSRTEGMPNVLLEAQLLGIPVITTDAGGCREIVKHGETGFVAPIGDYGLIATYLETLLTAEETAGLFSEEGKKRMRNEFNLERAVSGFESLYSKVY